MASYPILLKDHRVEKLGVAFAKKKIRPIRFLFRHSKPHIYCRRVSFPFIELSWVFISPDTAITSTHTHSHALSHTLSHTHTLIHNLTHTHSHAHTHTHTLTLTHTLRTLTHTHWRSHTLYALSHTHTYTLSLTYTLRTLTHTHWRSHTLYAHSHTLSHKLLLLVLDNFHASRAAFECGKAFSSESNARFCELLWLCSVCRMHS
jgi:hypothetical protein